MKFKPTYPYDGNPHAGNMQAANSGFIALITAVLVSAMVMAVALAGSDGIAAIFDETNRKEYRLEADQAALACLDTAFVELAHDYFYAVESPGILYADENCSIVSVQPVASTTLPGPLRSVAVKGFAADPRYHITATISAQVLLEDEKISLLSETIGF